MQYLHAAAAIDPTTNEYQVRLDYRDFPSGHTLAGFPLIYLPAASYDHAQAIVKTFNDHPDAAKRFTTG